jgi:hypothetical protein
MNSVIRDVKDIQPEERHIYEAVIGHSLTQDQRILVAVLPSGPVSDDFVRRRAREEFFGLCKRGTENRERFGVSVDEADAILDEAFRSVRPGRID